MRDFKACECEKPEFTKVNEDFEHEQQRRNHLLKSV